MQQAITMIAGSQKELGVKPRGWSSIGYHVQRDNQDGLLSVDFGLAEFGPSEMRSAVTSELHGVNDKNVEQRLNHYRKFLYEKGGTDGGQRPEVGDRKSDQGRDSCAQCPRFSAGSSDQSGIAGDSHLDRAQSSAKAEPQGAVAPSRSPIFIKWPVTSFLFMGCRNL